MDRKRILLVDDEAAICHMAHMTLGDALYEIVEAYNGLEAQKLLEKQKFDLIITDVIMPECDGIELVIASRRKLPDIKVVVMSGGGRVHASHYLSMAEKLGAARVLEKPFNAAALRRTVHELLNEST